MLSHGARSRLNEVKKTGKTGFIISEKTHLSEYNDVYHNASYYITIIVIIAKLGSAGRGNS